MLDMVVKAYFGPIQAIYELEALNPGDAFLKETLIPDPFGHTQIPLEIQIEINRLRNEEDGVEKAGILLNKARMGKRRLLLI